jgi:hypothetical protein
MVSYQFFTQTALTAIAGSLSTSIPSVATLIGSHLDLAGFICSFAWMFVLSAIVANLMFGRERRLSIQFLVSLGLTLLGSAALSLLHRAGVDLSNPSVLSGPFNAIFGNPYFASFYLALPFIFMVAIDIRAIRKRK